MRCSSLIILLLFAFPVLFHADEKPVKTFHYWLTYKTLPHVEYAIGLPESKFSLKGYSTNFGFSPLAAMSGDFEIDPLFSLRLRTNLYEEINPFKEILWRPHMIQAEGSLTNERKIMMMTAFVNNEVSISSVTLTNSGKDDWNQDLVIYSKGSKVTTEDYTARKAVTVFNEFKEKEGAVALGIYFDKTSISDISTSLDDGKYRIIAKVVVPAGKQIVFNVCVGFGNDAKQASLNSLSSSEVNFFDNLRDKEFYYNKMLSNITQIVTTDVQTRKFYQAFYLLLINYKKDNESNFGLGLILEDKLKKLLEKKLCPWVYWKAYEYTGDTTYLEYVAKNIASLPKMENDALEYYDQQTINWASNVLGEKIEYTPVVLPEKLEDEQKILYMILSGQDKKSIEVEIKKLLSKQKFKYPEIYIIADLLDKYDIKNNLRAVYDSLMPYNQYDEERSLSEVMLYPELFLKTCGLDFVHGNIYLQPLELYKYRNVTDFKYNNNYLDIVYDKDGKYIEKVLIDGNMTYSRILSLPYGTGTKHTITVVLNSWPSLPILNTIKSNSAYSVKKCGYDEKAQVFNIEMVTPPLESFKAVINITKNTKKIKKVFINGKDISQYNDIKIEFKEKGF